MDLLWDGSRFSIYDNCVVDIFRAEETTELGFKRFILTKNTYILTFYSPEFRIVITCLAVLLPSIKKGIQACIVDEMKYLFRIKKTGTHILTINRTPRQEYIPELDSVLFKMDNNTQINNTRINNTQINNTQINNTQINNTRINNTQINNTQINILFYEIPFYIKKNFLLFRLDNFDEEGNIIPDPPIEDVYNNYSILNSTNSDYCTISDRIITEQFQMNMIEILVFRALFGIRTTSKNIRIRKDIFSDSFYPIGCFETKINFESKLDPLSDTQYFRWFTRDLLKNKRKIEKGVGMKYYSESNFIVGKYDLGRVIANMARISLDKDEINADFNSLFDEIKKIIKRIDPEQLIILESLKDNMMLLLSPSFASLSSAHFAL